MQKDNEQAAYVRCTAFPRPVRYVFFKQDFCIATVTLEVRHGFIILLCDAALSLKDTLIKGKRPFNQRGFISFFSSKVLHKIAGLVH